MATLATIVNRFVGVRDLVGEIEESAVRTHTGIGRLRPIANEDVYLFVKRIDNSAVIRAADPAARRTRSHSVVSGFAAAMLIIAGLFPAAYNTMEGYHIQSLRQEGDKLRAERARLDLSEAKLLSPQRMEHLANTLNLIDPVPQNVQYLDGKTTREASNRDPLQSAFSKITR